VWGGGLRFRWIAEIANARAPAVPGGHGSEDGTWRVPHGCSPRIKPRKPITRDAETAAHIWRNLQINFAGCYGGWTAAGNYPRRAGYELQELCNRSRICGNHHNIIICGAINQYAYGIILLSSRGVWYSGYNNNNNIIVRRDTIIILYLRATRVRVVRRNGRRAHAAAAAEGVTRQICVLR